MDKPIDKKAAETLAMLIASKTGLDDNYALVARKVIDDYVGAKRIIQQYVETAERTAKKQVKEKRSADRQQKKSRIKDEKTQDK